MTPTNPAKGKNIVKKRSGEKETYQYFGDAGFDSAQPAFIV